MRRQHQRGLTMHLRWYKLLLSIRPTQLGSVAKGVLRVKRLVMNDVRSVSICNFALSDCNGQVQLYLRPSSNTGASSFYKYWKLGSRCQLVATKRLDDLLREMHVRHVRLIKIDCEGAEGLVLA